MERLDKLNQWTLEERRNRSDLIKFSKWQRISHQYHWPNSSNWTL